MLRRSQRGHNADRGSSRVDARAKPWELSIEEAGENASPLLIKRAVVTKLLDTWSKAGRGGRDQAARHGSNPQP